jgi:magnesium chelatase family protein
LVTTRPCRAPHQTISDAGLIGGGHVPMPGDVSLAHRCLLVLNQLSGQLSLISGMEEKASK